MPSLPKYEKEAQWLMIRISKDPKNPKIEEFCKFHFKTVISCYETDANRPHVHILCEIQYIRSVKTRSLLKDQFAYKGNTDFSVDNVAPTEEDFVRVSRYVCKGDGPKIPTDVVFRTENWTDELVELRKDEYWFYHASEEQILDGNSKYFLDQAEKESANTVKINLQTEEEHVKKPCKKVVNTWTQKIIIELGQQYEYHIGGEIIPANQIYWDWHNDSHVDWIQDYILEKLGNTAKCFDEYQLKKFIYGVFNALDAKNFRTDIKAKVNKILGR